MIRKIIQANEDCISLKLPDHLVGKKIEVIVFALEEDKSENDPDAVFTHFASEPVLASDWLKTEEDNAWKNL